MSATSGTRTVRFFSSQSRNLLDLSPGRFSSPFLLHPSTDRVFAHISFLFFRNIENPPLVAFRLHLLPLPTDRISSLHCPEGYLDNFEYFPPGASFHITFHPPSFVAQPSPTISLPKNNRTRAKRSAPSTFQPSSPLVFSCTRLLDWISRHIVQESQTQGMSRAFLLAGAQRPKCRIRC